MIIVSAKNKTLEFNGKVYKCAIGKSFCDYNTKVEGDGLTPLGTYPLREVLYRSDKFKSIPTTTLPVKTIHKDHRWSEDIENENYNTLIHQPDKKSDEGLFRLHDDLFDLIVVLGFNDNPVIKGKGSGIFFHVAREDYKPTKGCVAVSKTDLLEIILNCTPNTRMIIKE